MDVNKIENWNIRNLEGIFLSPTNFCNCRCIMCPNSRIKGKRGFLDWELFVRIINNIKSFYKNSDFLELHFYSDGEPFFHPRYVEMLEYIDHNLSDVIVQINTNGCLLNKERIDRILKLHNNNYVFVFSMDASNKGLYERIRIGGDYNSMEQNIMYFLEQKKRKKIRNPYVVLQFIVMPINEHDRHNFYWKWESSLGPETKNESVDWNKDLLLSNSAHVHWKEYHEGWSSHVVEDYDFEDSLILNRLLSVPNSSFYNPEISPKICAWLWNRLIIGWNGKIGTCCFHWEGLGLGGTVLGQSLSDAFTGKIMNNLRWRFLKGQHDMIPICRNCEQKHWWSNPGLENYFEL